MGSRDEAKEGVCVLACMHVPVCMGRNTGPKNLWQALV